MDTVNPARV